MVKENYNGIIYDCSDAYSNKCMTGWDLSGRTDMNNLVIHGLCLSNETPNAQVLPLGLTGTTFLFCNLDNVFVPSGNTIDESCSNRLFQVQADGQDWIVEAAQPQSQAFGRVGALHQQIASYTPVQPLNLAAAITQGKNTDPAQIAPNTSQAD